jgi:hypothetical protein
VRLVMLWLALKHREGELQAPKKKDKKTKKKCRNMLQLGAK